MDPVHFHIDQVQEFPRDGADHALSAPLDYRAQEPDERLRRPARECPAQQALLVGFRDPGRFENRLYFGVAPDDSRYSLDQVGVELHLTGFFAGLEKRLGIVPRDRRLSQFLISSEPRYCVTSLR